MLVSLLMNCWPDDYISYFLTVSSFQGIEAIIVPAVRSMMSKYISEDEQGMRVAIYTAVTCK